jgi:hypothetical protein
MSGNTQRSASDFLQSWVVENVNATIYEDRYGGASPTTTFGMLARGTTQPQSIVMLYFRYARLKNCAETLILGSTLAWRPPLVQS